MKLSAQYLCHISTLIEEVIAHEQSAIDRAGEIMAETIIKGGFVYVFGSGHSHMMAEELFYRAGGHTRVYPILEESLMLHHSASKSTVLERLPGHGQELLNNLALRANDCLIIASNSGRNNVIVDMALHAHNKSIPVIALTNIRHSSAQESRSPSGLKLYEIADVVIDNHGCVGDASIEVPESTHKSGATSTVIGSMIMQAVSLAAIDHMLTLGLRPELFVSSNVDEGDELNAALIEKYRNFIRPL